MLIRENVLIPGFVDYIIITLAVLLKNLIWPLVIRTIQHDLSVVLIWVENCFVKESFAWAKALVHNFIFFIFLVLIIKLFIVDQVDNLVLQRFLNQQLLCLRRVLILKSKCIYVIFSILVSTFDVTVLKWREFYFRLRKMFLIFHSYWNFLIFSKIIINDVVKS